LRYCIVEANYRQTQSRGLSAIGELLVTLFHQQTQVTKNKYTTSCRRGEGKLFDLRHLLLIYSYDRELIFHRINVIVTNFAIRLFGVWT